LGRGNSLKNWTKHHVLSDEAEEVFSNIPLILAADIPHSASENRYTALGKTDVGRRLFISFTARGEWIRVISARPMSKKEREKYEKRVQGNP
jgi:uncharacterized DUF497 family protein